MNEITEAPMFVEQEHPFAWRRGPASLDGEWVVLDVERSRPYYPAKTPELVYDLGAVRKPPDALAFVQRYGLLRTAADTGEPRERWSDIEDDAGTLAGVLRTVTLIRSATDGDSDALRRLRGLAERDTGLPRPRNDEELIKQATQLVVLLIDGGLTGVDYALAGFAGGHFAFTAQPPHLLGMAYHQLARAIVARVPLRECDECGRYFEVSNRGKRFCSKTCGGRARQRRFAQRQEAGQ